MFKSEFKNDQKVLKKKLKGNKLSKNFVYLYLKNFKSISNEWPLK